MGCKIRNIECFLPDKIVNSSQLTDLSDTLTAEKIEAKIGIRERRVVAANETALDLAYEAAKKVLKDYDRDRIDFIILCTQSPDYFLPTSACILQDKLDLRINIGAFDFNLGCSGYVYGLALSKAVVNGGLAKAVLFVTSETYTKHIHEKDIGNRIIFGDGAAATLIERHEQEHILEFCLGTDGKGWKNLIVANGGMRNKCDPSAEMNVDEFNGFRSDNHLYMNGPAIFNFTLETVPKLVDDVLKKNGLDRDEIDYFIFHQANKYIIDYLREKIGIPEKKFFSNILLTGNTGSTTIPLALKESIDNHSISPESTVLLCGFGVGYSWGATIIKI